MGRIVDSSGIHPDPEAIADIVATPPPTTVKALQSFLGSVNQYSRYSPHLAELTEPLRALLAKNVCWTWESAQDKAFKDVKAELASNRVLAQFDVELPTTLTTDASGHGLGAVLTQENETVVAC